MDKEIMGKMMFGIVRKLLLGCSFLAVPVLAHAQDAQNVEAQDLDIALNSGAQPEVRTGHASVEECWAAWKAKEGLEDGKNERNGYFILVSHQKAAIVEDPQSRSWLAGRNAAFSYAEMSARAGLAATMKTTITSSREAAVNMFGGDDAPPNLRPTVEKLSVADKSLVLVDKALDNEIKKYDPKWTGTGVSEKDKRDRIAKLQMTITQNVARNAELFASGAFTAVQCEGPSTEEDGKYSILVGLIWSPKLAQVAEAIWNPSVKLPAVEPQSPIKEQFAAFRSEDAAWMAYTSGARVFTNERGERVVVGFGVAPQSSLGAADKSRANLLAMAAIQRFVGEKIQADDEEKANYERREYLNDVSEPFDTSAYVQRIEATSKSLTLRGATEIDSWRGEHPFSHARMQVVALAWSPSWAADSKAMGDAMGAVERRMQQQGAVPQPGERQKAPARANGSAVPARSGAGVSTSNF